VAQKDIGANVDLDPEGEKEQEEDAKADAKEDFKEAKKEDAEAPEVSSG
jgi:hypothetical protein